MSKMFCHTRQQMFHILSDNLLVFLDEKSKTFDFEEEVIIWGP